MVTKKKLYFYSLKENEDIEPHLLKISTFFDGLLHEKIIIIGDGLTNLGYGMRFEDFIRLNKHFLSIPQHIFIWFNNQKKCINITFENDLFFG